MTLPSSGALSMSAINAEFGRGNNLNSYRGTVWYTDAGGSGTFSSGAIAMSDFYGKRATSPTFSFTISANQTSANLRTLAVNAGWNQSSGVQATIAGGVVLSGSPGLTINGAFPGGVTLINNGYITGLGGTGGRGGAPVGPYGGLPGSAGSTALAVSVPVTVQNNGIIGGGGGGGGGSSIQGTPKSGEIGGSGGGGGASYGPGGLRGPYSSGWFTYGNPGAAGGLTTGGAGGTNPLNPTNKGGNGGGLGSPGAQGYPAFVPAAPGGAAGACVTGNGYISWAAYGTRYGSIS